MLLFQVFLFVVLFLYSSEVEDYTKCELIGGESPRHLNTSSSLYIVAIVDCTHVHHVVH